MENPRPAPAPERGLTLAPFSDAPTTVQVTFELPDKLAAQLQPEGDRVAEFIARGMRRSWSANSSLRREVISFLARRPTADEIVAFRPSDADIERSRELLHRNSEGTLTPEEEAELDEMCDLDRFVSLIKAEVLLQTSGQA